MNEIAIYITLLYDGDGSMCDDPTIAQSVADELNGSDSHCVKGDEPGQWIIEEPALVDQHGIGRSQSIEKVRVCVEDAYSFYGDEMPVKMLRKLPKAVVERIVAGS